MQPPNDSLQYLRQCQSAYGARLYLGVDEYGGLSFADPEQAVLVLGPPRSGKTSGLVIPNVLAAPGPVLATSTKPDVLAATARSRSDLGQCWLFDPTGSVTTPPGVTSISWSPVAACHDWDASLVMARALVGAAKPGGRYGESAHWTERAEALLASLMHGAAISGGDMRAVVRWVLRQEPHAAAAAFRAQHAEVASDVLAGLSATDRREQSGIWSTAAGVLSAYRSDAALASAGAPNFDPAALARHADTVYICAPGQHQALVAPIVVAFVEQVRAGAYAAALDPSRRTPPLVMALDELANMAPLPELPALVSEGGSQGVLTLACLQDLSQARQRWGAVADGFLSLFGTTVMLPGIADRSTIDLVSRLAGEVNMPVASVTTSQWYSTARGAPSVTWTTRRQ
ncbi:MAG: type IV secretory system conjugative DNA transfer family protein, partial [Acidimicrobiales bacterium]